MTIKLPKLENAAPLRAIMFPAPNSTYERNLPALFYISKTTRTATSEVTENSVPALLISRKGSTRYVVYSHGNATDLGGCVHSLLQYAEKLDANILAYEYPGYGITQNNQETPTADGIRENIECAYTFLLNSRVAVENIFFLGRSIGSGPSCHAALELQKLAVVQHRRVGGLILVSPYTSIQGVACSLVPYLGWFCPYVFHNADLISRAEMQRVPVLLIHGEQDRVIPVSHSRQLYDTCTSKRKRAIYVELVGHNFDETCDEIVAEIVQFLDKDHRE